MQSPIYNFYCLNTLAKHFYRLNPLSYANYKIKLNSNIEVSSFSNILLNKLIVFDIDVSLNNKRFIESVMYYQPDKEHTNIKYNIDILNNSKLDTSLKFVYHFDKEITPQMNPYFWSNLSIENQTELNKVSELLKHINIKQNDEFIICK